MVGGSCPVHPGGGGKATMAVRGLICAALVVLAPVGAKAAEWSSAGQNIANTRHQAAESLITAATVTRLGVKWVATLASSTR